MALGLALGPGIFQGLLAAFLFLLPASFVGLMVAGLADPRREGWEAPARAAELKVAYRRVSVWGLRGLRLGVGLFLVQLLSLLVLRAAGCDTQATHLSAASWNLVFLADRLFFGVMVALGVLAFFGLLWGVRYLLMARHAQWADPRRKDALVVHAFIVPLALLLMWVAYGVAPRMVCPFVIT